jgi:hypothetical protein
VLKRVLISIISLGVLITFVGCQPEQIDSASGQGASVSACFKAHWVDIMGLTRIADSKEDEDVKVINIYVDILDKFEDRIKSPCTFRFEFYEYVPRSSRNKGERLDFWDNVDLTSPETNNMYWKDHLRAYQFGFDFNVEIKTGATYILEVMCMTTDGRRLTDEFELKY